VLNRAYRDANRSAILFDALLFSIVEAIGTAAVAALLWFGSGDLATGAIGAGTFIAFVQYIRRFFVPIRDLSTKYTVLQSAFAAAERVFVLLDEPVPIASPADAAPLGRFSREVALKDVWFAYRDEPGDADWVLRGVNLHVRRGEKVALVGATGSGKTTVLKLLSRSYDVQRGVVTVDGVDTRSVRLDELRRLFAVVLQDVFLFSGTILDNLSFAAGDDPEEAARVRQAAEAVRADEFIRRLPRGYDTAIRELGSNFSAGERQLLAFARALARDPEILVLDEATSSVDSETESRIQEALDVLLADRTAIVVAHRLSTVRKMDRILVMHHGRVVEEGDHETLLRAGGTYAKLAQLQFQDTAAQGPVLEPSDTGV
jgi:ATP-binding cassette subfamily B protein